MRAVKYELAGRERYLTFTVEAMFQIEETFGGVKELAEKMEPNTRESFAVICKAAAILAEQGELARRGMGYDPEPPADEAAIAAAIVHPFEMARLKMAITAALSLGFGREVEPENDEVDLYLQELNEQKKTR